MEIGEIVRRLREDKGLTQPELADLIKMERTSIYRYENDQTKVPNNVLEKIAEALGTTVPDIYAIKENPLILEDPVTFYRGKSQDRIQLIVTLDGTLGTLNSWISTMKKVNASLA